VSRGLRAEELLYRRLALLYGFYKPFYDPHIDIFFVANTFLNRAPRQALVAPRRLPVSLVASPHRLGSPLDEEVCSLPGIPLSESVLISMQPLLLASPGLSLPEVSPRTLPSRLPVSLLVVLRPLVSILPGDNL